MRTEVVDCPSDEDITTADVEQESVIVVDDTDKDDVGCGSIDDGDDQIAHEGHLDVTGDDEGGVTPDVDE
jgi:hypothetical protein